MNTNKFAALTAAANRAGARRVRSDLKQQMNSLTAAVSNTARFDKAQAVADATADGLDLVYQRWTQEPFAATAGNLTEFSKDINDVMQQDLVYSLEGAVTRSLRSRGFPLPDADTIHQLAVDAAKEVTGPIAVRDLFQRLQSAGPDQLGRYLGLDNAANRASHIALQASDQFENGLFNNAVDAGDLTGRRQWQTANPDSRNDALDGTVAEKDQGWTLSDSDNEEIQVDTPRPIGVNDPGTWSNAKDQLLYENSDGNFI